MNASADSPARSPLAVLAAIVVASVAALAVGHWLGDRTGLPPGERVLGGAVATQGADDVRYGRDALDEDGDGADDDDARSGGDAAGGDGAEGGAHGDPRGGPTGGPDGHAGGGSGSGTGGGSAGDGARSRASTVAGGGSGASGGGDSPAPTTASAAALAPATAATPPPPEDPPGALVGRVIDPDGAGIAGAAVRVLSGSRTYHNAAADGDGRYRIEKVVTGRYRLVARAPGYLDAAAPGVFDLAPSQTRLLDDIQLRRAGRVSGRVVDPEGNPVARAHVAAERGGAFGRYETRTAADGAFELFGFAAGKVKVRATHDDFLPSAWATLDVPALEDGTAGSVEGASLKLRAGASVEGSTTVSDGSSVNVGVALYDANGRRVERTASKGGAYRFEGLSAGRFQVATDAVSGAIAREDVTLAAGEHRTLNLVLAGGGVLTGACVNEKAEPVAGVKVTAAAQGISFSPSANTGADGRFRIEGLLDAAYVVSARPPDAFAVPEPLSVAIAGAGGPQEIAFQLVAGATIAGRATAVDGGPAGGARVTVHDRALGTRLAAVDADPAGRFRIPRLPAVEADVYVASGSQLARETRRLTGGEEMTVNLLLAPAARIRGVVTRASGAPAAGATVEAVSSEGVVKRSSKTNGSGAYELGTLYPGRYSVGARLGGAHAPPADVTVGPGQVLEGVALTIP